MEAQRASLAARSGDTGEPITCVELTCEPMSMDEFFRRVKRDGERLQRQDQRWHLGKFSLEGGRPANESQGRAVSVRFLRTSQVVEAGVMLP